MMRAENKSTVSASVLQLLQMFPATTCSASTIFTPMLMLLQIFSTIFEHPQFNSAQSKRKMMMDLLIEMNADAQEKLMIDGDEESVTESYENSQT
ncbi:hypothetical protein L3Y34_012952 [Caenorhabditis briggsae]|uniref:Uncharacterized protein n=1 Tax=Caenorhabditis briggsae TaxID=6238 RepID=A0AAE9CW46_CAEBR|nr:hypothetical protein L3Y34_012952 [Caenorhabditis briggsae]